MPIPDPATPSLSHQARRIAHDMANDLACIVLEFSLIEQDVASIPSVQENIKQIRLAIDRLSQKMRELSATCRALAGD
ncbi:MAG: hypothetical protein NZM04_01380 [Methylacidiphilales bacterium]|nr:hypothetical protein [Candidatus Methylacidiphilales bacterium]MDW8349359.1 hypothetical protein [Verrucomicrobiae bacterium]